MTQGALALAVSSALFLLVAYGRWSGDGTQRTLWAVCLVVVAAVSVATPLVLRGTRGRAARSKRGRSRRSLDTPPPSAPARVEILAIDGASLDFIARATAEGRLPNFGRILDAGAVMHLATLHPTSAEAVWAAVATGKLPQKNGVRSAAVYRPAGRRRSDPPAAGLLLCERPDAVRRPGRGAADAPARCGRGRSGAS